jgi:hypothetical protein
LFTGLRLIDGIDLAAIYDRYGVDVWARYGAELSPFLDEGCLKREGPRLRLTRRGNAYCSRGHDDFRLTVVRKSTLKYRPLEEAVMFRDAIRPVRGGRPAGLRLEFSSCSCRLARRARSSRPLPRARPSRCRTRESSQRRRHDLNFIKPDKVADFEMVMGKLKEALAKSENPQRKQQAASWKVFKSADPAGANTLYVYVIDPVVKAPTTRCRTSSPKRFRAEANEILKKYADCYAQGMNILNLIVLHDLGK